MPNRSTCILLSASAHRPPPIDEPEDFEPGLPPIDPDDGVIPPLIPDDPEHDRVIDPEG
jgi:hypothetical protein